MKPPLLLLAALCAAGCSKPQEPEFIEIDVPRFFVKESTNGPESIHYETRADGTSWIIISNAAEIWIDGTENAWFKNPKYKK